MNLSRAASAERRVNTARATQPHNSALRGGASGTALAFDFGTRRVGVAVGELALGIAHPLETIDVAPGPARLEKIALLIREWSPALLVVGLPSHIDGSEHVLSARCRRFASHLKRAFGLETHLVDERLTSYAAGQSLAAAGVRGRQRKKGLLDQLAAVHILQTFFATRDDAA